MESIAEIQEMRVSELKEFLRRNEVQAASIARADGTDGPPRKSDLLSAALHIRADYDNPQARGPTSPKAPRNIFQSGYSPQSARALTAEKAAGKATAASPKRRASDISSNADMNSARKRAARPSAVADDAATRKPRARRRSSGWINPAFNPQLTPKGGAKAATPARAARRVELADEVVEVPPDDFGDAGDQIIASDYDSASGGASGIESDGGSVVETDEDEGNPDQFKSMKVYEIRAWLNDHDVTFNHRAKKAELISLATAHALYLENIAAAASEKSKKAAAATVQETADDETTAFVEDEAEKAARVSAAKEQRRYPSRKSGEVTPIAGANKEDEIIAKARAAAKDGSAYRRSRSRVIAAPLPDDEKEGERKKVVDDEIVPVGKKKRIKRRHAHKERPPKEAAGSIFRFPAVKMPTVIVTRRGVMFFAAVVLVALLTASLVNIWARSKWPFCDTGAEQGIMPDGSECHPCPLNGACENGKLTCAEGYFRSGNRCVEDEEVSRYADHLERKIVRTLSQVKGKYQCGEASAPGLSEAQIRESVDPNPRSVPKEKRKPRKLKFDPSKFDAAFQRAVLSLRMNEEDDIDYNIVTQAYEALEGRRSFKCVVRQFLYRHIGYVLAISALCILIARWRIQRFFRLREEARIEDLYEAALEVLREVRVNYVEDDRGDAFMIDTQLREELLGRTTNEKVKLWVKVEELLRADSRVLRSGPRSIKGMPCYVYEWRGNLRRPSTGSAGRDGFRALSGSDTESRRRLSFGSGSRRQSGGYESSPGGSPSGRRPSTSPSGSAGVSPGYRNMLNFWNR